MARPRFHLRTYQPGDIDRFRPRADFAQERAAVAWDWAEGPPRGRSWTLVREAADESWGEICGVGGLYAWGAGYWQAWAILADLPPRELVAAAQLATQALDGFATFNPGATISATARLELRGAQLLLEKLGFVAGGVVTDARVGPDVAYRYMVRAA